MATRRELEVLGQPEKAKRAMYWFYGFLAFCVMCLFEPEVIANGTRTAAMAINLAWAFLVVMPQVKLVEGTYGKEFVHRPWGKPVKVALGWLVASVVIAGLVLSVFGEG